MTFTLFILGNGRAGYLDHTIASWEANLVTKPKYKVLFDDSGNAQYRNYLKKKYGHIYQIVQIAEKPVGQQKAMVFIFNYLKQLDTEYYLQLEEDWVLNRSLDIYPILNVLDLNKNIIQMRLPRTVWYTRKHYFDLMYGSNIVWQREAKGVEFNKKNKGDLSWLEKKSSYYFWSHNPNIFPKSILDYEYPETHGSIDHEQGFGLKLLKDNKDYVCGCWASNDFDAYVTHIGVHDLSLENKINQYIQKRK